MALDVVRGNNSQIEPTKSLVQTISNLFLEKKYEGTLYLGYPLTASADNKFTLDALLVSKELGLIVFVFPREGYDIKSLQEEQDALYYQLDYNFKKNDKLRKGRELAFRPIVISILPPGNHEEKRNDEYNFLLLQTVSQKLLEETSFNSCLYPLISEAVQRVSNIKPRKKRESVTDDLSFGGKIKKIEKEIANLDQWQKKAALEVPDGPQRIRGLAGSGKTIVLALKAAYLHSEHPKWRIAVTFYSRALAQQYKELIRQFSYEFSGDEPNWDNLNIIHAWGTANEPGLYSITASHLRVTPHNFTSAQIKYGRNDAFEGICDELYSKIHSEFIPFFDVVLIDEAQDMPKSFFKIANSITKDPKRIVWGYDELQNLSEVAMPTLKEMFGSTETGSSKINLDNNEDEAERDIILPICYRNPPWILALAHSLGFGIYREKGFVQLFDDFKLWEQIGYRIKSGELEYKKNVSLQRKQESTPKYFSELLKPEESIVSKVFDNVGDQYKWCAEEIYKDIHTNQLDPDDILVIFPDVYYHKSEYYQFRTYLESLEISSILAGVSTDRDTFRIQGNVTASSIYRAKGNEAPMVYILNSEHCAEDIEMIKVRNTLFTSITRSRAWVRICGVGSKMELLNNEIEACISNNFQLNFITPSPEELSKLRKINSDKTEKQKEKRSKVQMQLKEMLKEYQSGDIDLTSIPEFEALINTVRKSDSGDDDETI